MQPSCAPTLPSLDSLVKAALSLFCVPPRLTFFVCLRANCAPSKSQGYTIPRSLRAHFTEASLNNQSPVPPAALNDGSRGAEAVNMDQCDFT